MDASTPSVTASLPRATPPKRHWMRWLAVVVVLLILCIAPLAQRRYFTCAICGMSRQTWIALSLPVSHNETGTECSRWYRDNVEPQHDHIWVRGTWTEMYSIVGLRVGISHMSGHADGPLVRFGSGIRHLMYQRCSDPKIARDAFVRLSRWDREDTAARQEQIAIERALAQWEDSGLVGPWPLPDPRGDSTQ